MSNVSRFAAFANVGNYFYRNQNPHAPRQSNGLRFHGYPQRYGGLNAIRVIALHTAENIPDISGADFSAEAVASYGAGTDRVASWHVVTDRDSKIKCLPDIAVAYHIADFNTPSLGLEIATQAHLWGRNKKADVELLRQAAWVVARWSIRYRIYLRMLSRGQASNNGVGVVRHSTMDPSRRSDPGSDFPVALFFRMVRYRRTALRTIGVRAVRPRR